MRTRKRLILLLSLLLLTVAFLLAWQFAPYQLVIENKSGQPIKNIKITGFWQLFGGKQDNEPAPLTAAELADGASVSFWVTGRSGSVSFEATTSTGASMRYWEPTRAKAPPKEAIFTIDGVRIESRHLLPSDLFLRYY